MLVSNVGKPRNKAKSLLLKVMVESTRKTKNPNIEKGHDSGSGLGAGEARGCFSFCKV